MTMKTVVLVGLLSLYFLLSAITAKPLFPITNKSNGGSSEPVLDIEGEELSTNKTYYITSIFWGALGGGATMDFDSKCPLPVIKSGPLLDGLPLTFTPIAQTEDDVVHESCNLNIKFSVTTPCNGSTAWRVNQVDENSGQYFVITGGVEGHSGPENTFSWFKIIKSGYLGYKLVFSPSECDSCEVSSRDIGLYFDGNQTHLALGDNPFLVVFKKAWSSCMHLPSY